MQRGPHVAGILFACTLLTGCSDAIGPIIPLNLNPASPGPPAPTPKRTGIVAGAVFNEQSLYVLGARVELLDGPRAGAMVLQEAGSSWEEPPGFYFDDLPPLVPTLVRVTASGYKTIELWITPFEWGNYTVIALTRDQ